MTEKDLSRANELRKEIRELDHFIYVASKVWTGKIICKEIQLLFNTTPYGIFEREQYFMKTDIKNKVLDVLRDHLEELKKEFEQL